MAKRYNITSRINNKTIRFQEPLDDPFVNHRIIIGWRMLLRAIFHGELLVTVIIGADRETINAVLDLNKEN